MFDFINRFRADEEGAVTVDWVVLTAAVVGLAVVSYGAIADSNETVVNATAATVLTAQDYLTN